MMPSVSNLEGRALAERIWRVHPDVQVPIDGEWVDAVSRQSLIEGVLDGVVMLDRSGGVLTVIVGRTPTELPGEMVTTGAIVQWKNRTDATPQPEQTTTVPVHSAGLFERTEPETVDEPEHFDEPDTITLDGEPVAVTVEPSPDGLDYAKLPEEDLSDIPVHAR